MVAHHAQRLNLHAVAYGFFVYARNKLLGTHLHELGLAAQEGENLTMWLELGEVIHDLNLKHINLKHLACFFGCLVEPQHKAHISKLMFQKLNLAQLYNFDSYQILQLLLFALRSC